jgi:ABC-type glycerol-3-phosphate transport system substrate-binding protein
MIGCKSKQNEQSKEKKKLNVYVNVKDKYSVNIIKFLIDEFMKEKKDIEVTLNNPLDGDKMEEDIVNSSAGDLILTSRTTMIELTRKGLLNDLTTAYTKNNINDAFYNIMSTYGRVGDKYYGIGIVPYTVEVFYNTENLQKQGLSIPKNIGDIVGILKKMNENKTRVPIVFPEDLDIYNGIASIIASNTIDIQKLEKNYDSGMSNYKLITEMQKLFNDVYFLSKYGSVNKDTFEVAGDNAINRLTEGDIPILIGLSYLSKDIKDKKIGVIEKYNITQNKEVVPVIMNCLVCAPTTAKNEESSNSFIEYILGEKAQKLLLKEGLITGNKKLNANLEGINKIISQHLAEANNNSIIYLYNLPKKLHSPLELKLIKVLGGEYNGNEWNDLLEASYKK